MEIIEIQVYEFEELKPDIQTKVIEDNRTINVDHISWYDWILEEFAERLEAIGFEGAKIHFSGFASQGDGACFDCDNVDVRKLVEFRKVYQPDDRLLHWLEKSDEFYNDFELSIEVLDHHYQHENTRRMDSSWNYYSSGTCCISKVLDTFQEEVEALRLEICREIYSGLEADYEYQTSDEAIQETIEANEYRFRDNGDMWV